MDTPACEVGVGNGEMAEGITRAQRSPGIELEGHGSQTLLRQLGRQRVGAVRCPEVRGLKVAQCLGNVQEMPAISY